MLSQVDRTLRWSTTPVGSLQGLGTRVSRFSSKAVHLKAEIILDRPDVARLSFIRD